MSDGPFFVDKAKDAFGYTYVGLWAIWYRCWRDNRLKQTGHKPFYIKVLAGCKVKELNKKWTTRQLTGCWLEY